MPAFISGDTPVADFDYDIPAAADENGATVTLSVADQTVPATIGNGVEGTWSTLTLPAPGSYPVYIVAALGGRTQRTLVDYLVVVDPDDPWYNVVTARIDWDGAPESDGTLADLLDSARDQVLAYAPALAAGAAVPTRYKRGQLMQARNTFNASQTNGDQQVDAGGGVYITVRPLDWAVKQVLRPKQAKKRLG